MFLIRHSRREIIHFNVTESPTSEWVVQQLREAFSDGSEDRYLIFDRDAKFGADVQRFLDSAGISAMRTSYRSPWQNGVAERWVRSFRNDLLDHVIVAHEGRVNRLARDYLHYYHADRTHDGVNKILLKGGRNRSGIPVRDWFRFLVLEVSTIDIPGQRLHERGGWIMGDVHPSNQACGRGSTPARNIRAVV